MSMVNGYPGSYAFGPRHVEGDDAPPSLMFPYQPGSPEEEEEMELLRQWEAGQGEGARSAASGEEDPARLGQGIGEAEKLSPATGRPVARGNGYRTLMEMAEESPWRSWQDPAVGTPTLDQPAAQRPSEEGGDINQSGLYPGKSIFAGDAGRFIQKSALLDNTDQASTILLAQTTPAANETPGGTDAPSQPVNEPNKRAPSPPPAPPSPPKNVTPAPETPNPQQSPDKKPGDTPEGLEYALKFTAGTLVDGLLNSAVAIFGGPGKYSYNPSPVRRAWGVDDMLPKIDQEAYNRIQDGAEMLAFSFAEARNPRNRINVGIPAPTWRNRDGTPLSREEAARWLKEYHSKLQRTGSGEFEISMEVAGMKNGLKSWLDQGTLKFDIERKANDGTMRGKEMFDAMMKFYGPAVKAVQGNWVDGDNLAKVNELTRHGTPIESALRMSWTGIEAARHGFTELEINYLGGEAGKYTDIQVTFRRKTES